jgi:hypothetical protein
MITPRDIRLPDGETLKVEEVAEGMYCFPDAYKALKEDFFKGLVSPIHVGGGAAAAPAREAEKPAQPLP